MDHGPKVVVVAPRPVTLATPLIVPYEVVPARLVENFMSACWIHIIHVERGKAEQCRRRSDGSV